MPVAGCCHPVTPASPQGQPVAKCTGPGWAAPPCSRARRRAVSPTTRSAPSPLHRRHPAPDPAPRSITDTSLHIRHPAPHPAPCSTNHQPRAPAPDQAPEPPPRSGNTRSNVHLLAQGAGRRQSHDAFRRTVLAGVSPTTVSGAQCRAGPAPRHVPERGHGRTMERRPTTVGPAPEPPTEEDSANGLPHRSRGGPGMRISPAARQAPSPPAMKSASYPLSRIGWTRWPDRRPMSHTRMKCGSGSARGSSP